MVYLKLDQNKKHQTPNSPASEQPAKQPKMQLYFSFFEFSLATRQNKLLDFYNERVGMDVIYCNETAYVAFYSIREMHRTNACSHI